MNLIRTFVISLVILTALIGAATDCRAQNVAVWAERTETHPGQSGSVGFYCDSNVPLYSIRVPVKLESASIIIDSVQFSGLVNNGYFNLGIALTEANRRGFVQVLPSISNQTFYAFNAEIFRIHYRVKPSATENSVVVDTFYNRFYDVGFWIVDELEVTDDQLRLVRPSFTTGQIAINVTTDVDDDDAALPAGFVLEQNYPNPFNPATTIGFTLPRNEHVKLEIYDLLGRKVADLLDTELQAGRHEAIWNAEGIGSGHYFYRLDYGEGVIHRKMTLLK